MSKRLPNPFMIKFNSNLVIFFGIFSISISGINRNANTLIRYLKEYLNTTKINIDILQSPINSYCMSIEKLLFRTRFI